MNLQSEDFQAALKELDTYTDVSIEDLMRIHKSAQRYAQLRQTGNVAVKDIMTREIVTVTPETSIKEAAQNLLTHRISGLPVVNNENKLVGIVTEADFLNAIGIPSHHPTHSLWHTLQLMFTHRPNALETPRTVADIMKADVVTIQADQTLHEVIDLMKRHSIKRIVVTDATNQVEGMITRSNLVRVVMLKLF